MVMTINEPSFGTTENAANVTRNFAPIGIMAMGMTVVIITGGIDLSVGSVMGLVAIVAGLFLTWHYPWYVAFTMGMIAGLVCGMVNGFFVAYVGMPSFVVTLGMLSIARSLAVVFSANQMLYQFGPAAPIVKAIGQAKWPSHAPGGWVPRWFPELSSHFWVMIGLALIVGYVFNSKAWGRHLFAIGGNEQAARLTGVPVDWIKFQAYVFSAFTASLASLLLLGYNGSAINAMGQGYELRVIAATVIGGGELMGGGGAALRGFFGLGFFPGIPPDLLFGGGRFDLRGGHCLRGFHRFGLSRGHPQCLVDGGHRFELAGRIRRRLHYSRGASRHANRGQVNHCGQFGVVVAEKAPLETEFTAGNQ